jgi:hypothetical protein
LSVLRGLPRWGLSDAKSVDRRIGLGNGVAHEGREAACQSVRGIAIERVG